MATNFIFRSAHLRNLGQCSLSTSVQCIRSLTTIVNDSSSHEKKQPVVLQNKKLLEAGDTVSVDKLITVEDIDAFCNLTGDFNTIHTQSRIVHGALLNGEFGVRCDRHGTTRARLHGRIADSQLSQALRCARQCHRYRGDNERAEDRAMRLQLPDR